MPGDYFVFLRPEGVGVPFLAEDGMAAGKSSRTDHIGISLNAVILAPPRKNASIAPRDIFYGPNAPHSATRTKPAGRFPLLQYKLLTLPSFVTSTGTFTHQGSVISTSTIWCEALPKSSPNGSVQMYTLRVQISKMEILVGI
jgi:hypothetical protein